MSQASDFKKTVYFGFYAAFAIMVVGNLVGVGLLILGINQVSTAGGPDCSPNASPRMFYHECCSLAITNQISTAVCTRVASCCTRVALLGHAGTSHRCWCDLLSGS